MRVLIAESDGVARDLLVAHLAAAGHEVLTAVDGLEAWTIFTETSDVDVVISDWRMPELDGLELCRRVREADRDEYTYFLFLTGLGERHVVQGIDAGADDYLTKPLDGQELTARLKTAARVTTLHRRLLEQNAQLERLTVQLTEQSRNDPLTGLGNRLRLAEDLEVLRAQVQRYGHDYCLVLCDLDEFKSYNDRYGHQAGDEALRRVGSAIREECRLGDSAYRYGGEEFLVLLPQQGLRGGMVFAERLRRAVHDLGLVHEGNQPSGVVTFSIGVAALSEAVEGTSSEELLNAADRALYEAKARGRNMVVASGGACA
jgi:two-component system cell cycle response regulator